VKTIWERRAFYTRLIDRRPYFIRGPLPKELAAKSRVTKRRWKQYEDHIARENPISKGMRYLRVFENETVNSYAEAAVILETSRQRV
jgi:hypothetical protein